jgi:transposase
MTYQSSWRYERVLRRPKREDHRSSEARDGQEERSRSHLLRFSLSSLKRYAKLAEQGRSLTPKKRPGSKPKIDERASKLLEEDIKERPFITLQQRCEYLRTIASLEVSRSTVCRAIKRMNSTRKKGEDQPQNATSS